MKKATFKQFCRECHLNPNSQLARTEYKIYSDNWGKK